MFATAAGWAVQPIADDPVVLMLTVDAPTQEALWREWLPPHSKILVNSKTWRPASADTTFKLIENNVTETAWGRYSLVQAHEAMLREGMAMFPKASHFVLVSGDSAPVKTYDDFVQHFHKNQGVTLMSELDVHILGSKASFTVLSMLQEAKANDIGLGWWDRFAKANKDIPAAAQWSAISNQAVRVLLAQSMTEKAQDYERVTTGLGLWGKVAAADEMVVQAIIMENKLPLNLNDMSPMWVRHDRNDVTKIFTYQEVLREVDQDPKWIFARKIKPFTASSRADVAMIKERMGLDVPLPAAAAATIHLVPFRRGTFLDLA